jgi:hypothetical protein
MLVILQQMQGRVASAVSRRYDLHMDDESPRPTAPQRRSRRPTSSKSKNTAPTLLLGKRGIYLIGPGKVVSLTCIDWEKFFKVAKG